MATLQQDGNWQSDLLQALLSLIGVGLLVPGAGHLAPVPPRRTPADAA